MAFFDWIERIAASFVTLTVLVGAGWGFWRWRHKPRFICGIPPSSEEQRRRGIPVSLLGSPSVATAFRHRPDCFAGDFKNRHKPELDEDDRRELLDQQNPRSRTIVVDDNRAALPVLLANHGGRIARDYSATVVFYAYGGGVRVVDVLTETLDFYVYASRPEQLRRPLPAAAPAEIVAAYNDYMMTGLSMWGDLIFLSGDLEADMFELALVTVEVDDSLGEFFVVYTVDCADGWIGARTYAQGCRVLRETPRS